MKKKAGIIAGVVIVILVGAFTYVYQTVEGATGEGRIIKGVTCQGIQLDGMTKVQAQKALQKYADKELKSDMTFYVNEEKAKASMKKLGVSYQVKETVEQAYEMGRNGNIFSRFSSVSSKKHVIAMVKAYDKTKFEKYIKKVTKDIVREPVNATVKRKKKKFKIIKEKTGYALKEAETFTAFQKAVASDQKKSPLMVTVKQAKYKEADVKTIKDELSTFVTYYGSSPSGRKGNVANGASKVNKTVLYPGDKFSLYDTVSPFTAKNGYFLAGSYENGTTVETYGGGICQVSTTLYNAAIRAELKILERHPHSMTVHYVPISADAAIAGTDKNLRFQNSLKTPIYIEGRTDGAYIRFTIYGKKTDKKRKVSFESETISTREGTGERTIYDSSLPAGARVESSPHTGYTARLWKIVKVKGKKTKRTVFNNSYYMSTPKTIRVGTGTSQ